MGIRRSVVHASLITAAVLLAYLVLAAQPVEGHAGHLGGTPPAWDPQVPSGFTFDQVADIGEAGTDMEIVNSSGQLFAADQSGYVVSVEHASGDQRQVLDITSLTPATLEGRGDCTPYSRTRTSPRTAGSMSPTPAARWTESQSTTA
jgi:hypothetical protein